MSDCIGLVGAFVATLLALATISMVGPRLGLRLLPGRSAPIDGLRGYAAFFVFLGHATAWFYFVRTGRWAIMPIRAYGNFGSVSVIVFFMITAFLFTTKLLDSRRGRMDWLRMLVSRFMRLTPLYLFAMAALLAVLGAATGFELNEGVPSLLLSTGRWLGFTIAGAPDMNGLRDTWLIIAGVTWSLPYEIFFYLLLPLLALLMRAPTPAAIVAICTAIAAAVFLAGLQWMLAVPFLGGMLAALLVRVPRLKALAQTPAASVAALAALVAVAVLFWSSFRWIPLALISLAFCAVAAGNSLFGLLTTRAARMLGEVSYSMYLLHAIALYALVRWGIGTATLIQMPALAYWAIILGLTPLLVTLCVATFVLIERPGIGSTSHIVAAIRGRWPRRTASPG